MGSVKIPGLLDVAGVERARRYTRPSPNVLMIRIVRSRTRSSSARRSERTGNTTTQPTVGAYLVDCIFPFFELGSAF